MNIITKIRNVKIEKIVNKNFPSLKTAYSILLSVGTTSPNISINSDFDNVVTKMLFEKPTKDSAAIIVKYTSDRGTRVVEGPNDDVNDLICINK